MKRNFMLRGCLVVLGLAVLLLAAAGVWWFLRPADQLTGAPPSSPVLVFLVSPANGDEFTAGDYLPVMVQALAPEAIISAELFVDGQSLGVISDSPEDAWWTWQAWPAGIHTLSARATAADGQVGQSQTVVVTVLAGDGVMQILAEDGQTLEQIGTAFGMPPDQMTSVNPQVDPTQPLASGQPIQIPTGGGEAEGGDQPQPGVSPAGGSILKLINWQFQTNQPVDKSYCYFSLGDGIWEKMPKKPFDFFSGAKVNYPHYNFNLNGEKGVIQAQCWGWLGDTLQYLGQGETQFDVQKLPDQWVLIGSGFQLVGVPEFQPLTDTGGTGGSMTVPPPFALRAPSSKEECYQGHGFGALFLCELLDTQVTKQQYVLVWEWQPPVCWPGSCITKIDGYRVYEIDKYAKTEKFLKEISNSGQKVTAVPLGWGTCFGVRAFVNDPALEDSEMSTWCPSQPPQPKISTYQPSHILTVTDDWFWIEDDCGGVGHLFPVPNANESMVGVIQVALDDCGAQYRGTIGVKFPVPTLPQGAVLQKAAMRFNMHELSYKVYYDGKKWLATNVNWMCPTNLGIAKVDWTGWGGNFNFSFAPPDLNVPSAMEPYMTLPRFPGSDVEVTPIVNQWMKSPQTNQGLVLYLDWGRIYDDHFDYGAKIQECFAFLSGLELDVFYFTPD